MTKPKEKTREELTSEIEESKKKIRQYENRGYYSQDVHPTARSPSDK